MKKFDELLGELEKLQKAEPPAENEDVDDGEEDILDENEIAEPDDDDGAEVEMKKSLTLEDGTEIEIEDAAPLMKSFDEKVAAMQATADSQAEAFGKVLEVQTNLIKSLHAEIESLRNEGRGRKSVVVSLAEKKAVADPGPEQISYEQVMAKCLDAQKTGRLTSLDVAFAEASLNRGAELPARIIAALG